MVTCHKPPFLRCLIRLAPLVAVVTCLFPPSLSSAADVIIFGDTRLKPVSELVGIIRKNLRISVSVYTPQEVNGKLQHAVAREGAKAVIALGKDAIDEALRLPSSIGVIYDMVILPVTVDRPNTTGTFMATPTAEYRALLRRYIPSLQHVSVLGTPLMYRSLRGAGDDTTAFQEASSPFDIVNRLQQLGPTNALLLLPDPALLSESALEKIYLYSFRKKIPVLGVSEKNVKQGALLALVFDPSSVGKQLAKLAAESVRGTDLSSIPPSPSQRFLLYVNVETARKMGLALPDEMLRQAKGVYPHD